MSVMTGSWRLCLHFILACFLFSCVSDLTYAQSQDDSENSNVVTYDSAYFEAYNPISAKDMLNRVPGADAILGQDQGDSRDDQRRGLRSNTDQILINGKRVTAKGNSIQEYFDRISAAQVIRIEVISGNVREIDADVGARVINVVLDEDTGGASGTWHMGNLFYDHGQMQPSGYLSYNGDTGNWSYTIFGETRPDRPNRDLVNLITTPDEVTEQVEKRTIKRRAYLGRGRVAYTWGSDRFIQLNGFYEKKPIRVFESEFIFDVEPAGNRTPLDATLERRNGSNTDWEVSGDYAMPLSASLRLETLFVVRADLHNRINDNFSIVGERENLINGDRENKKNYENILRNTLDWAVADRHNIEVGVEDAINTLDVVQNVFRVIDDEPDDLLNTDQKVSEDRVEVFSSHNWKVSDKIEIETGLAAEFSWIDQAGLDVPVNRSFNFIKPTFDAWYNANQATQLWFSFKRDVGQLDFEDFVAELDRNDGEIDLGNPELRPEKSFDFEIGVERRFPDQKGLINGRVFYRRVTDVSDEIPFVDKDSLTVTDSQPGNIGSGDHYGFEIESSLRLSQFNLIDAVLGGSFLWQNSSVVDAFSGRKREFALQDDYVVSVNFRHDLKRWGLSYSLDYTDQGPRIRSEFDRFRVGNPRSNLRLIVEKQVWEDVILRFLWNNVFKTTNRRKTTVFQTNQASGIVNSVEFRRITPQISVGIGLIGKF